MRFLLMALAVSATAAQAGELPAFNVDAHCESAAALMNGARSVKLTCLKQEQEAYDALKARWSHIPAEVHEVCSSERSYQSLGFCIDRELQSIRELPNFKFKK